ncbi:MAG: ABC transporter permease [candidate division Zixibacteria bacterium]|nr:ABC transporter permease [candidate division Zixibacteria bacterium]
MKFRRLWAVVFKEFLQISRDTRILVMAFAVPVGMLVLFGYAVTLDINNLPLGVYDQDNSQESRGLVSSLMRSGYFSVESYADSYQGLLNLIEKGKIKIALVIPYDFSKKIKSGEKVEVQTILDGSDANTATIGAGYLTGALQLYSLKLTQIEINPPIDGRIRIWYNEELKSKNYIIPGLIAVIMMIIGTLLTSLVIAREWERGTMEQLIATPIQSSELIFGKLVPYFAIGMIDLLLAVLLGRIIFKVPFRGSFLLMFLVSCIFLAGALGIGMFISILTKSQQLAYQMALLTSFLPGYILSGFIFPIFNMPLFLRIITHIVPARYYIKILQGIFLKGNGFPSLIPEILLLSIFALIMLSIANLIFKKRLPD